MKTLNYWKSDNDTHTQNTTRSTSVLRYDSYIDEEEEEMNYSIKIVDGHHIVDMNPKESPFEIALRDFSTSVETAAKAFREYFKGLPKIR